MFGSPLRLFVAMFGALVLALGSLPCEAQAMPNDCDMSGLASDHQDKSYSGGTADCAVGCRLAPLSGPTLSPPSRVTYAVHYIDTQPSLAGITLAPDTPVPRRMT